MGLLTWMFGGSAPPQQGLAGVRQASVQDRRLGRCPRNTQAFYEERGWRLQGDSLHGWYRTRCGSFQGRIERPFGQSARYFIYRPPDRLLRGPHGLCFHERAKDQFEVHWSTKPPDVNTGILRMEHTLLEALQ